MKRELMLSILVAMGVGPIAMADEQSNLSPQALGSVEAILDKCAEVDPSNADRYHGQVQMVTQGVSSEAVAKARKSEDYKTAYDAASESLSAVVAAEAVKTCRGSLVAGQ